MDKQNLPMQDALQSFISDGTSDLVRARYASLPGIASEADFGELDRNIVVLDTETTGFSFNHDELTQIAAARMEKGEILEWFITFVNPGKPIPEDVARLTDIHDEDVADAPSASEALEDLVAFVGDAKIIAHNADFDRTFTTRHPSGYPLLENAWIDSLDLARIALPRMRSHRLLDLVRAFGAPLSTHRADADVASTCAIFRILLAGVACMPPALVGEIARLATCEEWSTQVVFDRFAQAYERAARANSQDEEPCKATVSSEGVEAEGAEGEEDAPAGDGRPPAEDRAADGYDEGLDRFAAQVRPADLAFSLRALRRSRLRKLEREPKADAEDIAADPGKDLVFPTDEEVRRAFSADGLVGSLYDDFEPRSEQLAMAEAVRSAFADSVNLMVEAGTGVGKSMAYLVPAALVSRANNVAVGLATKTNALLDQLVYHELPALSAAFSAFEPKSPPLSFAPLKGFSHYPCLRKIENLLSEGAQMRLVNNKQQSQAPSIAALLSFIEQTGYDDMDSLKMDYRVLPRRAVTTTAHDCLRRRCPFYGTSCFVHGSRRRAESADIVVTNHSLLFCDLVADGGLLPPVRHWVVDEAHGAEAEARRAFSITLAAEDVARLAARVGAEESARNVFIRAERRTGSSLEEETSALFFALCSKAKLAGKVYAQAAGNFSEHLKDLLFFDQNKRGRNYEIVELWINGEIRASETFSLIKTLGDSMARAADGLVAACQNLLSFLEDVEGAAEVERELATTAIELKDQIKAVDVILRDAPDSYAYAATLSRKKERPADKLEALLINVGEAMNETLFERTHAVVFASATLAVGESFDAFESALGLNAGEHSVCRSCKLDSSYDYDAHMTVYVADDIPEPNDEGYLSALQALLIDVHRAQQGSLLTLFTNRREMERCFEAVQPRLKEDDLRLVCQKWGVSVKGLRDDFLADEHLSLFALKSFWEGFDAPGSTLKGVVIPKLPFAKPTDPLSCERAARDDQAWRHFVLPAAVLETKQAAGRLIRKADDVGVLILTDRRLLTKSYGKVFLGSLPSKTIKVLPSAAIAADLKSAQAR